MKQMTIIKQSGSFIKRHEYFMFIIVSRSVVSKVEMVTPLVDVFTPGSEDFDVSYYICCDI